MSVAASLSQCCWLTFQCLSFPPPLLSRKMKEAYLFLLIHLFSLGLLPLPLWQRWLQVLAGSPSFHQGSERAGLAKALAWGLGLLPASGFLICKAGGTVVLSFLGG